MAQTQRLGHHTRIQTNKAIQGAAIETIETTVERLLGQETLPMIARERLTTGSCGYSLFRLGLNSQKFTCPDSAQITISVWFVNT